MRGVTVESISKYDEIMHRYNERGEGYTIRKTKGKLTMEEIQKALEEKRIEGLFCIMFRTCEDTYSGWDYDSPQGDAVDVWMVEQDMPCPVCMKLSTVLYWCPECGQMVRQRGDE